MAELLNISTIVKARDTVHIVSKLHPKGRSYPFQGMNDLGPYEYQLIFDRNETVDRLKRLAARTAAQERELDQALVDLLKILTPQIEPAVVAGLENPQREMIVATWSVSVSSDIPDPGSEEGNRPARRRTTAGSSRASNGSTAASRKHGSTSRRG
jgi:hypothetical protein